MSMRRVFAVVKMELKRLVKEPLILIFTVLLVPLLIMLFGLTMSGTEDAWYPGYNIFEVMLPGMLVYGSILTIYDVASSIATQRELGLQKRINATPLSSGEYLLSQMISYTVKPLIQLVLGLGMAVIVGFRPQTTVVGYLVLILFMVLITFCSVGFGMITASFAKSGSTAGGLAFAFIVPQQIFATFIPPEFMGANLFKWVFPSYYATRGSFLLFAGVPLTGTYQYTIEMWILLGILAVITVVIYIIGMILFEKKRKT